jgi:RNA polymerase sigma factor (sigma-70 family)
MINRESYANAYKTGLRSTIRVLLSKGLRMEDAEEFAQRAWARGWEARDQLQIADRLVHWVNSIAVNLIRTEKRRTKRLVEFDGREQNYASDAIPVTEKIDVGNLLKRCSLLDRSLMICRYAGGFSMGEIARMHGLTSIATRVRIHRAKAALRRFVEGDQCRAAA